MRALITGITGFVGGHLQNHLNANGDEVYGSSRRWSSSNEIYQLDLQDKDQILHLLKEIKPTHIFHLAGMSNVRESWSNILKTIEVNTVGTINLLESVKNFNKGIRVITVGSSEEYGNIASFNNKISETTSLNPMSPYGTSKAAVSMLMKQYHKGYDLDVIHIRPFNHIGPRQKLGFVTSDFAYQIALINKGKTTFNEIKVGNLEAFRDFTDVRDVVKAYHMLALHGQAGEIYNVCSGEGTKIQEILDLLVSFSDKKIEIKVDPEKMRPSDVPYFVGDYTKLKKITNWSPTITLTNSLQDIYRNWLNVL